MGTLYSAGGFGEVKAPPPVFWRRGFFCSGGLAVARCGLAYHITTSPPHRHGSCPLDSVACLVVEMNQENLGKRRGEDRAGRIGDEH